MRSMSGVVQLVEAHSVDAFQNALGQLQQDPEIDLTHRALAARATIIPRREGRAAPW